MNQRVSSRKGLALSAFWERLTKLPTLLLTLALPLPDVLHRADHAIVKVDIAGALIKVIDALLTGAAAIDRQVAFVGRPTPRLHQFLPRLPHYEGAPRRSVAVLGPAILGRWRRQLKSSALGADRALVLLEGHAAVGGHAFELRESGRWSSQNQ